MFIATASLWYRMTLTTILLAAVAANVLCYALASLAHSGASAPFPLSALLVSLALSLIIAALCWLLLRRHFAN
jgi:hypothetical protein